MTPTCELCDAVKMTTWWFEDDVCWIAECESCFVPMVVWKRHGTDPSDGDRTFMLEQLRGVAEVHGPKRFWIDESRRSIPDHYHAHARRVMGS
jgi:hypothetical protein